RAVRGPAWLVTPQTAQGHQFRRHFPTVIVPRRKPGVRRKRSRTASSLGRIAVKSQCYCRSRKETLEPRSTRVTRPSLPHPSLDRESVERSAVEGRPSVGAGCHFLAASESHQISNTHSLRSGARFHPRLRFGPRLRETRVPR